MKTFYEIMGNKSYKELTIKEKDEIQERQTTLVIQWQDETNPYRKLEIEDELYDSFKGLIAGMAYRQSMKSFSVDEEEFQGIISLALAETMVAFDRSLNKPFQPVFITYVKYAILEMYRDKGYDLHDTAYHLDSPIKPTWIEESVSTPADKQPLRIFEQSTDIVDIQVSIEKILTELFDTDERKKTVVHMHLDGFKRNEIVSAVAVQGKSPSTVAKYVNRTIKDFKEYCRNLSSGNLL